MLSETAARGGVRLVADYEKRRRAQSKVAHHQLTALLPASGWLKEEPGKNVIVLFLLCPPAPCVMNAELSTGKRE